MQQLSAAHHSALFMFSYLTLVLLQSHRETFCAIYLLKREIISQLYHQSILRHSQGACSFHCKEQIFNSEQIHLLSPKSYITLHPGICWFPLTTKLLKRKSICRRESQNLNLNLELLKKFHFLIDLKQIKNRIQQKELIHIYIKKGEK